MIEGQKQDWRQPDDAALGFPACRRCGGIKLRFKVQKRGPLLVRCLTCDLESDVDDLSPGDRNPAGSRGE